MQRNKWNRKLEWVKKDDMYIQQNKVETYDENKFIAIGDIYFRFNKYLTGVTFTYINTLTDIYKKDLLTGDGNCIYNMYNEYDVIDRVMKNFVCVEIASNINIDLNKQQNIIDNIKIKPNYLVLLKNQDNVIENDIYIVNKNNFLINSEILSSKDKSNKFSCSVKSGTNKDKQFFLKDNGVDFPIFFESKEFIEGQSYILKNIINYNVYDTLCPKIIFTDIKLAKSQIINNYELYYPIIITGLNINNKPNEFIKLDYHHLDSYIIRSTNKNIIISGYTSEIYNNDYTTIPIDNDFDCIIGDYINLKMYSGNTLLLEHYAWIKNIVDNNIVLEEIIPTRILNELKNSYFIIDNLNIATDWYNVIERANLSPYNDFCIFTAYTYESYNTEFIDININSTVSTYNKYFDYTDLYISSEDNNQVYNFITDNFYLKYSLYDRLSHINSGFTTDFSIFNETLISGSTLVRYKYTDDSRIVITTSINVKNLFKPYTYVNVSAIDENTEKTLVYSVNDFEIIIEKPKKWLTYNTQLQKPYLYSIQNIDGLKNISDILDEVYKNENWNWYISKSENEKKYICRSYGELLSSQEFFRDNVTGLLYENDNNEYILKLYDLENDPNLYFESNELIFIGSDKKSRLPVPLKKLVDNIYVSNIIEP